MPQNNTAAKPQPIQSQPLAQHPILQFLRPKKSPKAPKANKPTSPKKPTTTTEQAAIQHNGETINYTIVRSKRRKKTVEITLDPQAGVIVRSPARTAAADIADLVRKRAGWILAHAAHNPAPRRFTDGETLPYLGKDTPIIATHNDNNDNNAIIATHNDTGAITIRHENGAFRISAPAGMPEQERIDQTRSALENWYRQEAQRILPQAVGRRQASVSDKKPTQILIRNQRKRWGSCAANGVIRLNWRIIMAEPALIDYLIVHELAHLAVMDHSPRYWQQVERALPEYRRLRKRLNEVGPHLWL